MTFHIQNPDYNLLVRSVFGRAAFITDLGIWLLDVGEDVGAVVGGVRNA